ncbi:hypothetical protein TIFTF001_024882 [Ficus carica]|uniref:Mei2-like C-terminal RNA recognition motif domain-containing protein n=1 Tax=Ficus carica TaxID=3494 RepID=A0AA88B0Y5_FICCA|nr:hypothetical protein TIFTF001_024882 [Ficus carica]
MAGSGTEKENMGKGREIMRSVLNPAAPEFFPQNYHQPFFIPNIITTTHQFHYNNYLYPNNSHNYFLVPPPLPPPPPPTHFPLAMPADEAEDHPQRHHRHHHHDQTAMVAVAADHHHDEEENRRRNQRRPRRRGSGLLGRKTRRRVLRGNSLTELNKGYAFVNFTSPQAASKFSEVANGQTWDHFHSFKRREIARARLQGKEELIRHFKSMVFPCGSEEFLPVWFVPPRDGTNKESVTETTVGWSVAPGPVDYSSGDELMRFLSGQFSQVV